MKQESVIIHSSNRFLTKMEKEKKIKEIVF
jgi:hypothetical protein